MVGTSDADLLGWLKTGWFELVVGVVMGVYNVALLAMADSTRAGVVAAVFVVICLSLIWTGARRIIERRRT